MVAAHQQAQHQGDQHQPRPEVQSQHQEDQTGLEGLSAHKKWRSLLAARRKREKHRNYAQLQLPGHGFQEEWTEHVLHWPDDNRSRYLHRTQQLPKIPKGQRSRVGPGHPKGPNQANSPLNKHPAACLGEPSLALLIKPADRHGLDAGEEDVHPQTEEILMMLYAIEYDY